MKNEIKFGTDGWRGITGFDFVEDKIKIISAGLFEYLDEKKNIAAAKKSAKNPPKVVVGYDTRFLSDRFAKTAARVMSHFGLSVSLSDRFITTPMLSCAVLASKADLGVMITASHNPYYYNGYKIKGPYGGSATVDIIKVIEEKVNALNNNRDARTMLNNIKYNNGCNNFSNADFSKTYRDYVMGLVDIEVIKQSLDFPVVVDPMYGAGQATLKNIIENLSSSKVHEIHSCLNTSFGGLNPEPIGDNLADAVKAVKGKKCMLALCLDGDGDRIGAIGENGNFISSHHIFAILLNYLVKTKNLSGRVIKTVSTSSIIDRICIKYGLELLVKPVGFKYIGEEILKGGVLMGGEESGGLWINGYMPERDGMYMSLMLLEILCREKKSANEILKDIYNEFGYFIYKRADYEVENDRKDRLSALLSKKIPDALVNEVSAEPLLIDGYKYILKDGSWIMIRPSGTEAVVRIYAESNTSEKLEYLHCIGKKILDNV
ncbi:MAG: Phosphoglucomutase [Actinobacteria bacterium ADurb.Bin346]|nr:MAG: Phosphoglucomutase [Actinobacteria bacterium ADurb.Bin346]